MVRFLANAGSRCARARARARVCVCVCVCVWGAVADSHLRLQLTEEEAQIIMKVFDSRREPQGYTSVLPSFFVLLRPNDNLG